MFAVPLRLVKPAQLCKRCAAQKKCSERISDLTDVEIANRGTIVAFEIVQFTVVGPHVVEIVRHAGLSQFVVALALTKHPQVHIRRPDHVQT